MAAKYSVPRSLSYVTSFEEAYERKWKLLIVPSTCCSFQTISRAKSEGRFRRSSTTKTTFSNNNRGTYPRAGASFELIVTIVEDIQCYISRMHIVDLRTGYSSADCVHCVRKKAPPCYNGSWYAMGLRFLLRPLLSIDLAWE